MKKFVYLLAVVMLMGLVACGNPGNNDKGDSAGSNATESETDRAENQDEETKKAEEEKKAAEEAKKAEEEKKAEEARKAEEEKKAAEEAKKAEEEKKAEEARKAKEEKALRNGIDDEVDMSQINMFDEEKIMYVQKSVNVRTGPDKKYDRITSLKINDPVQVLGQYGAKGWYMIKLNDKNAFVSNNFLGDTEVDLEALKAQQEAAAAAAAQTQAQQQTQNPAQPASQQAQPASAPVAVSAPAGILFIGDSRCVQMQEAVAGGGSTWVCEGGKGYDWFSTTGLAKADPVVGKGTKVVICLGVNDTRNGSKYAALINAKAAEWAGRGAKTYFVSVNPVWENPWVTEDEVVNFNNYMIGQLSGVCWIDTHSFLVNNGYYLVDGLHYDTNTYINIFNVIVGSLR